MPGFPYKFLAFQFFCCFIYSAVLGQIRSSFDWKDLLNLVENDKTITTRDALIARLPDHLFSDENHVLMRESQGPCMAEVTAEFPRVILFDPNTKTQIAYYGNPAGKCSNVIEVVKYRPETDSYDMYKITFPKPSGRPQIQSLALDPQSKTYSAVVHDLESAEKHPIAINNAECIHCHGDPNNPAKPIAIWSKDVGVWPGAFGEWTGRIQEIDDIQKEEAKGFNSFLQTNFRDDFRNPAYARFKSYSKLNGDWHNLNRGPSPIDKLEQEKLFATLPPSKLTKYKEFLAQRVYERVLPNADALINIESVLGAAKVTFVRGASGVSAGRIAHSDSIPTACVACHLSSPKIPFFDEVKLSAHLKENDGEFAAEVLDRINSHDPEYRMPPGEPLSLDEKEKFLSYLRKLAPEAMKTAEAAWSLEEAREILEPKQNYCPGGPSKGK